MARGRGGRSRGPNAGRGFAGYASRAAFRSAGNARAMAWTRASGGGKRGGRGGGGRGGRPPGGGGGGGSDDQWKQEILEAIAMEAQEMAFEMCGNTGQTSIIQMLVDANGFMEAAQAASKGDGAEDVLAGILSQRAQEYYEAVSEIISEVGGQIDERAGAVGKV